MWRGELYFETHRGTLTSQIRTKLGNRRCEQLLREAELWAATSGVSADLDELWREVLTLQFHDILPGSSIAWVHADAEATHTRVELQLRDRIDALLAPLAPATPTLTSIASHDRDEIVVVDDLDDRPCRWCAGPHAVRQRTDAAARRRRVGVSCRDSRQRDGGGGRPAR